MDGAKPLGELYEVFILEIEPVELSTPVRRIKVEES